MDEKTETDSWTSPSYDPQRSYDEIQGHVCETCRLVWVGGSTPEELGLQEDHETTSQRVESFVESLAGITTEQEPDHGHGYYDCLLCDTTSIDGFTATLLISP